MRMTCFLESDSLHKRKPTQIAPLTRLNTAPDPEHRALQARSVSCRRVCKPPAADGQHIRICVLQPRHAPCDMKACGRMAAKRQSNLRKVSYIFQAFDANRDARLDRNELAALIQKCNPTVTFSDVQLHAITDEVMQP